MPPGKRQQTSAMLYTLIAFVGLFIIATTAAVVFYVKFEDQRKAALEAQRNLDEMATAIEWRNRGKIAGTKQAGETYLGTMVDHLDKAVSLIVGGPLEDTSGEAKVNTASSKVKNALALVADYIDIATVDPNAPGLVPIIEKLKTALDNATNAGAALKRQLEESQQGFDDAMKATQEKENELLAEKEDFYKRLLEIEQKYNELKLLMEQTSDERAQTIMAQRDEARANAKTLSDELLRTQAELGMAQDRMKHALEKLQQIKPLPERETEAYQPDAKIVLVDDQAGVVHLNIGTADHVYRGLTFSVYDRNAPIPKDGKGKAEVEVFGIAKNICAARIIASEKKNPIAVDDIVANLIWDSDKTNAFVVAGEFDLDGDETIDHDALSRIAALIERWGGKTVDKVSIETDFLVLGKPPQVPPKPTFEDLEVDPLAMEKYEAAQQRLDHYQSVQSVAQALWIPVFDYERFLYLIGYKGQINKPGAF